jgi:hypothetical protein
MAEGVVVILQPEQFARRPPRAAPWDRSSLQHFISAKSRALKRIKLYVLHT